MSKQLYEEALADIKKLKEVAEDNAKRAILEAVTPRIKDLIENELLGEASEEFDPRSGSEDPVTDGPLHDESTTESDSDDVEESAAKQTDESEVYEMSYESIKKLGSLVSDAPEHEFSKRFSAIAETTKKLRSQLLSETKVDHSSTIASTISEIEDMYACLQESATPSPKKKIYEDELEKCFRTLTMLMERKMTKNKKMLNENDLTFTITGLPDMDDDALDSLNVEIEAPSKEEGGEEAAGDEEDMDLDLGSDEGDESSSDEAEEAEDEGDKMEARQLSDDLVVEIDEGMLRREISRMKMLREAEETKAQSWGNGPGKVADGFEDEDLGDPVLDVDLTTEAADLDEEQSQDEDKKSASEQQELDELDQAMKAHAVEELDQAMKAHTEESQELDEYGMDESDEEEVSQGPTKKVPSEMKSHPAVQSNRQPNLPETLQHDLKAEMELQAEAKKKAGQAKKAAKEAAAKKDSKKAKQMSEAYAFYARRFNESVARANKIQGALNEATRNENTSNGVSTRSAEETNNLRTKLAETNLFNAKLLYANKVLQNESLTKRQKAQVIERLDEAKNVREVKLVYESLAKTLQSTSTRTVTESTNRSVVGSSSRAERPASTLNEGFEADRWARLAGIIK